jgi:cullin 3
MAPKQKFHIQPFKQHAPMDDDHVQKTWSTLRHAIDQIFAHNASGLSFEELYRCAARGGGVVARRAALRVRQRRFHATLALPDTRAYRPAHAPPSPAVAHRRNAYNMVLHKHGERLYNGLTETVRAHLLSMAGEVDSTNDAEFLEVLNKKWSEHKLSMMMIRDILMYMVRAAP